MNMENGWWNTPAYLRHLNMMYTMLDGNSKTRRFQKTGGEDHSPYNGKGYFPDVKEYVKFLKKTAKHKLNVSHLLLWAAVGDLML